MRTPSDEEKRKLFGIALENLINQAMENHIYTFNGEIRKQSKGGAIGNVLTGALATIYMVKWTRDFKTKLSEATSEFPLFKLYLFLAYVDDGNGASSSLPPGARLIDGKVQILEEEVENDKQIPADIRTSEIVLEIANSVSDFIELTVDSPSRHETGWMPILDLQVQVSNNDITYKFYKKEVSHHLLMLERSALPVKMKRNSLVQEGIRRLRNTKRELDWSVKSEILSEFSFALYMSGYSEKFRLETIQSAVIGYERQCERSDKGETPLHRPKDWEKEKRRKKKLLTKTSWYRPNSVVAFYPQTPDQELLKEIQPIISESCGRLGLRGKAIEMGGVSVRNQLCRLDLTGCIQPDCPLCESGLAGGSHTRRGVVYTGQCTLCQEKGLDARYVGETGDSAYHRQTEHAGDIKRKETTNAFAKHLEVFHPDRAGDKSVFKIKTEATFRKCVERQCHEGVMIESSKDKVDVLLNSKSEWHGSAVTRVTTERDGDDSSKTTRRRARADR